MESRASKPSKHKWMGTRVFQLQPCMLTSQQCSTSPLAASLNEALCIHRSPGSSCAHSGLESFVWLADSQVNPELLVGGSLPPTTTPTPPKSQFLMAVHGVLPRVRHLGTA